MNYLEKENNRFNAIKIDSTLLPGFYGGLVNFLSPLTPREKQSITTKFETIHESIHFNFISFNYTNALDMCVNLASTSSNIGSLSYGRYTNICNITRNIIHVHGTLNQFPVIGVSNINDIANSDFRENPDIQTVLLKSQSITSIGQFWYKEAEELIESSKIICIFGMSLGQTDSNWWSNIARWLTLDKNNELIIFWYDKDYINNRFISKFSGITNAVKNKFISFSGFSKDEINYIYNRIHVVINTTSVLSTKINDVINNDNT